MAELTEDQKRFPVGAIVAYRNSEHRYVVTASFRQFFRAEHETADAKVKVYHPHDSADWTRVG